MSDFAAIEHEIINRCAQSAGVISFSEFMEIALYHPEFGYYCQDRPIFGKAGDFVTAPEMGNLFGQCNAVQCAEILKNLNGGSILEFGAGSGKFALTLLKALEGLDQLPEHYFILEKSTSLQKKQRDLLAQLPSHLKDRVVWINTLPVDFCGVMIANEVLDALPCFRFKWQCGNVFEMAVHFSEGIFQWVEKSADDLLSKAVLALNLKRDQEDYISELRLNYTAWLGEISRSLKRGVVLLFDYGYPQAEYYHPQRDRGTLACFFQHRTHDDPFQNIGQQDITAHVNFTSVARNALTAGFKVAGFASQTWYLLQCGIDQFLESETLTPEIYQKRQEAKMLLLSHEMGQLIKCLALEKNYDFPLRAFSAFNQAYSLGVG